MLRPTDDARADSPGHTGVIGRYRLLRTLGVGGMSEVYLGYDPVERRSVAVKVLAAHLSREKQFVNRFYREARLGREFVHPSLVHGYGFGYDPAAEKHYLVMEYIDGPTARQVLESGGKWPAAAAVRVIRDVAAALEYMHVRQYVHRDVKPENILLPADGPAKLADLGLAKRLTGDSQLTAANQGVGTPSYMPHEQAMNAALVDARSDVYALGATLYHLLTGEVPPVEGALPHAEIPVQLEPVLRRMLARDPRDRYAAAAAAHAALGFAGPPCDDEEYARFIGSPRDTLPLATADQPTRPDLPPAPVGSQAGKGRGAARRWGMTLVALALVASVTLACVVSVKSAFSPRVTKKHVTTDTVTQ